MIKRLRTGVDYFAFWLLFNYAIANISECKGDFKLSEKILEIFVGCYDFNEKNGVLTEDEKLELLFRLTLASENCDKPLQVIRYAEMLLGVGSKIPLERKAQVLTEVGRAHITLSQFEKAEKRLKQSQKITKGLRNPKLEAEVLYLFGRLYRDTSHFDEAIRNYERALKLFEQCHDARVFRACSALGSVYSIIGQNLDAKKYLERALEIAKDLGNTVYIGRISHNLANVYCLVDENDKALDCYKEALRIAVEMSDKEGEDRACSSLGRFYKREGKLEEAANYHKRSLQISRELGDMRGQAISTNNLGNVYTKMGEYEKAKELIQRALEISVSSDCRDTLGEKLYHHSLGSAHYWDGEHTPACENYCKSISIGEKLRKDFEQRDQFNMSMAKQDFEQHNMLTMTLLKLDHPNKALLVSDVGRSKALFDLLRLSSSRIDNNRVESHRIQWIEEIPSMIDDPTKDSHAEISENISRSLPNGSVLYFDFDITQTILLIWALTPHGTFQRRWSPSNCKSSVKFFQCVLKKLKDARAPSRYNLGLEDKRDYVREKNVEMLNELPDEIPKDLLSDIQREDSQKKDESEFGVIDREEDSNRGASSRGGDSQQGTSIKGYVSSAYQSLIEPVEDVLTGSKLVIVPAGPLFQLPFSALLDRDGKFLCDRYSIQLTPALHTLNYSLSIPVKPLGPAVCVGNPNVGKVSFRSREVDISSLTGAEDEVTETATYFEAKPLLGKEATKAKVLQRIKNASVVHIAAHGNMNYGEIFLAPNPKAPSLPTEKHYLLLPEDITQCSLAARLVVLSCCHSGRGEISSEGVAGTARAFLGAGARAVLVALWALPDEETREFMKLFYGNVCGGVSVCVALQQAMKTFKERNGQMEAWAPFEIFGEDVSITGEDIKEIRRLSREKQRNETREHHGLKTK